MNDETEQLERLEDWKNQICNLVDKHALVKTFKINPNKIEWISKELKEEIGKINAIRKKLDTKGGSSDEWKSWRQLRNKVNEKLKTAKKEYLKTRWNQQMQNSKTHWEGVKEYLGWSSDMGRVGPYQS